jgi:Spy/CpxP family protein refolding chaperone
MNIRRNAATAACIVSAICAALLTAGPIVHANAQAGGRKMRVNRIQATLAQLNLTPDQKTKIKPIAEDARKQTTALRTDTTLTKDQKKEKAKAIGKSFMEKILPILTADQKAKLKSMREEAKEKREEKTAAPVTATAPAP